MGIPLPALSLQPPPDAAGSIGKLLALKSMLGQQQMQQQEIALKQQQVEDQKTVMGYIQQNPKSTFGDAAEALKGKISLPAYTNLVDTDATIQQKHAAANEAELNNFQKVHDQQQKIYSNVMNLSDADLAQQTPQIAQQFNSIPGNKVQLDPNQPLTKQQLQQHGALLGLQETYLKQEADKRKETAETTEATQKGEEAGANAEEKKQQTLWYKTHGGAPGVSPEMLTLSDYLNMPAKPGEAPHSPANFMAWKAQQTSQAEAPVRIATAEAEGRARATIEHEFATKSNAALSNVPTHLVQPATAAAEKANTEYADAKSVADRMQATMDTAKKGNVVSYQIIPQEGTLQITTSQGVHRINKTEIEQYAGGGSLWQRMEGHFGKALTGKSIPDSVLQDMQEIQDIQRQGATERYTNKLKSVNQTYGSAFAPVEMEGLKGSSAQKPAAMTADEFKKKHGIP